MEEEIINRVAESGLVTLNLEDYHDHTEKVVIDIKPWLFREAILKEKDFRQFVKEHNWEQYTGKLVILTCSADAIIPVWAYMLITVSVQPFGKRVFFGSAPAFETLLFEEAMAKVDFSTFQDQRVIVKGCGDLPIPENAYVTITAALLPFAKSILYGEACSNVPVYKKRS